MFTPSSSAVVVASPTRLPSLSAASSRRRSSGRYPDRYAATGASAEVDCSTLRAAMATASAPRRDRMKASVWTFSLTRAASRSAVCAVAVRRSRVPASPRAPASDGSSGGSHSAKASGPRGDPSSVTSSASSPVSSRAQAAGEPMVAEESTNTGSDPAWCATTRRSRRSTCPTCEPKTPRYPWHSSMIT